MAWKESEFHNMSKINCYICIFSFPSADDQISAERQRGVHHRMGDGEQFPPSVPDQCCWKSPEGRLQTFEVPLKTLSLLHNSLLFVLQLINSSKHQCLVSHHLHVGF